MREKQFEVVFESPVYVKDEEEEKKVTKLFKTNLLFGNSHVILNIGEHSGLNKESFVAIPCSSRHKCCSFLVATLYKRQNLCKLLLVHLQITSKTVSQPGFQGNTI